MTAAIHSSRLPSIMAPTQQLRDEVASMNPGIVLTATSRYRNDPYRLDVRVPFVPARPPAVEFTAPQPDPYAWHGGAANPMGIAKTLGTDPAAQMIFPAKTLRGARHTLPALPTEPQARNDRARNPRGRRATGPESPQPVATTPSEMDTHVIAPPPQNLKVALIKFKRTHLSALYDPAKIGGLSTGAIVIVQGDRGDHIATIVSAHLARPKSTPTTIIRMATGDDLVQYQRVQDEEAIALEACRAHATRLGLDGLMQIVDVEFQLDFQKLTIYFQSKTEGSFVDFRNLQRALYQHFRCRIWIVDC